MTPELLTDIISTTNKRLITRRLKKLGYIYCKKDRELRNLSIQTLFKGELKETKTFPDGNRKRTYQGGIFTQVKGYDAFEFVLININDNKHIFPVDLLIWTKEIRK